MDKTLLETLKGDIKTMIDSSIKENIADIAGKEVSESVKAIVAKMRNDRALYGVDASGLSDETKLALAEDFKKHCKRKNGCRNIQGALLINSDEAGGYLVLAKFTLESCAFASAGLVARDAMKMPMGTNELDVPRYTAADLEGAYLGEDVEGSESSVTFKDAKLVAKTWYVILRVGNTLMSDAKVNLMDWLIGLVAEGLAVKLDKEGFKGGTYAGSPFVGLLGSDDVTVSHYQQDTTHLLNLTWTMLRT